uniref:Uncharacterized protein n=1 Tax=Globodera pallida TaxID=36090 RepID=A0A183C189_GLOPA
MFFKIFLFLFGIFVANFGPDFSYELGKEDVSAPFARKASGGCERVVVGESQRRRRPPPLVIVCAEFSASPKTSGPEAPTLKQPNSRRILHCANASVLLRLLTPGERLAILKVAATAQPVDTSPAVGEGPSGSASGGVWQRQNTHAIDNGGGRGKLRWKQQQEKQEKMLAAQQPEESQSTADDMKTYAEFEDYPVQGQRLHDFEPLAADFLINLNDF